MCPGGPPRPGGDGMGAEAPGNLSKLDKIGPHGSIICVNEVNRGPGRARDVWSPWRRGLGGGMGPVGPPISLVGKSTLIRLYSLKY
jgi:hypothetical protein